MKLTQLAAKPQLVKIELNDEETLKEYGEPIEFFMWDRQPIDRYVQMATIKSDNMSAMVELVNEMVLDESGNKILIDGQTLPASIMTKVLNTVVETLGK